VRQGVARRRKDDWSALRWAPLTDEKQTVHRSDLEDAKRCVQAWMSAFTETGYVLYTLAFQPTYTRVTFYSAYIIHGAQERGVAALLAQIIFSSFM
jgi:hypothetical protein